MYDYLVLIPLNLLFVLPFLEESTRGIGYSLLLIATLPLSIYLFRTKLKIDLIGWIFILFLLAATLSTFFSLNFWKSLTTLFLYYSYFITFLSVKHYPAKERLFKIILTSLIFNTLFLGILSIVSFRYKPDYPGLDGMNLYYAIFGHNNLDKLLMLSFPISLISFISTKSRSTKICWLFLSLFSFVLLWLSFGRTSIILGTLFVILSGLLFFRNSITKLILIILTLVSFGFTSLLLFNSLRSSSILTFPNQYFNRQFFRPVEKDQRLAYLHQSLIALQSSPLLGTGLDTFRYWSYKYQGKPRSWSWFSMNHYLQLYAETGILGGTSFGLLIILIIYYSYKFASGDSRKKALWWALVLSAIHSFFDYDWQFISILLYFFVIAGYLTPSEESSANKTLRKYLRSGIVIISLFIAVFGLLQLSGSFLKYLSNYRDEERYLLLAANISPWRGEYFQILGQYYYNKRDYKSAIYYLDKSVSLEPLNPDIHYLLENIYFSESQYESAEKEFNRLMDLNPKDFYEILHQQLFTLYLEIGKTKLNQNQITEAIDYFNKANEYWRGSPSQLDRATRYFNLAKIYLKENNQISAKSALTDYLEILTNGK